MGMGITALPQGGCEEGMTQSWRLAGSQCLDGAGCTEEGQEALQHWEGFPACLLWMS